MAGIANDYLIYPIIDLIRSELSKFRHEFIQEGNPFEGTPSISLHREHPLDADKVTGASLFYESGYTISIFLIFGSDDVSTFPVGINESHPDYEYYKLWRLTEVNVVSYDMNGEVLLTYNIRLNYDDRGLLTDTEVYRIN